MSDPPFPPLSARQDFQEVRRDHISFPAAMHTIHGRNVNDCWTAATHLVWDEARQTDSRNGAVYRLPEPLAVRFEQPRERVLFDPARNANPFFHLMESLWLLAGRHDVEWISQFNSRMATYSDDGVWLPASYGYRWRAYFAHDQLRLLERVLRKQPGTRRAVLGMWNPDAFGDLDMAEMSKDVPCNLCAVFSVRDHALCMVVYNRSNDLAWGLFGANVVHFSMLQEYLASRLGLSVGWYEQVTADGHVYPEHWPAPLPGAHPYDLLRHPEASCPYTRGLVKPVTLMLEPDLWESDLVAFLHPRWEYAVFSEPWFVNVALPMRRAWLQRKDLDVAISYLHDAPPSDWTAAGRQWLVRYHQRRSQSKEAAVS